MTASKGQVSPTVRVQAACGVYKGAAIRWTPGRITTGTQWFQWCREWRQSLGHALRQGFSGRGRAEQLHAIPSSPLLPTVKHRTGKITSLFSSDLSVKQLKLCPVNKLEAAVHEVDRFRGRGMVPRHEKKQNDCCGNPPITV